MKILFDQGTPVPLRRVLTTHDVSTTFETGWSNLENGALLQAAETQFEVFVTTDQNLKHQQNLTGKRLAILGLPTTNWLEIQLYASEIAEAVDEIRAGEYRELKWAK
jgi:predicted nuclease of predicted toxin-antitoxin system